MAIAFLMEAPGDAHPGAYDAVNEKMDIGNNPAPGLIIHTAGHAENGSWRIFDVWESREAPRDVRRGAPRPGAPRGDWRPGAGARRR